MLSVSDIGERSRLATGYCEYLGDESEGSPVKRADESRESESRFEN